MFNPENLNRTLSELGAQPSEQLFDQLQIAHREAGRFYHNEQHISECLVHFQKLQTLAEQPAEIEIAFWFHDAIYDTKSNDNEERSADWAKQALTSLGVSPACIERVVALIIATKTHQTYDTDSAIMVDIDLGILGASEEAFERYDAAIRSEYFWVPWAQYVHGRRRVLQAFLGREFIYQTAFFREHYEQQARQNLVRKLALLSNT